MKMSTTRLHVNNALQDRIKKPAIRPKALIRINWDGELSG